MKIQKKNNLMITTYPTVAAITKVIAGIKLAIAAAIDGEPKCTP